MITSDETMIVTDVGPPRAFDQACRMVVDYLGETVPLGAWAVTRVAAGWQTVLVAHDRDYGLAPGAGNRWTDTMCRTMISGETPRVVPDVALRPELAAPHESAAALDFPIGAYVGTPIVQPGGELFGTLLGINRDPMDPGFVEHEGLLDLLSSLLSSVLEADTTSVESARELERAVSDAETDQLTGLLNRRGWTRWLEREEERFRRFGDPACVVMMDLDGLKTVNDTEGHEAGDRYLQRTAETLRHATRHGDPLARLGGDEFAMVATVGPDDAGPLVDRLHRVLDEAGTPCSIGVAPVGVATGFSEAVSEADAAMYSDKRARKAGTRS
ncbi:sensor domain-containing diguanylate cyclase [Actinomycetospora sp. CA-084318]|uniref:sensor domain-containing diguanylate cyclase n=1 Tax=Actinomycetospora sp. CA-084318 TaxID=3239892 RepID=UPI003D9584D6